MVNYVEGNESYSLKKLFYDVNLPVLNVKSFGLITSTGISTSRSIFGFTEKSERTEDILLNRKTILSGESKIMYNENKIDFNHTKSPEFDCWKWVSYWYPIRQVVVFKRDVYRKVLKEFMVSALPRNITPVGKLKGCTRSNGDGRTRRKFC
jgi:hypothetical protein